MDFLPTRTIDQFDYELYVFGRSTSILDYFMEL